MKIVSNINRVIERMQRLKPAVHKAQTELTNPEKWIERARAVAEAALNAIATEGEARLVERFVRVVQAIPIEGGFSLKLRNPLPHIPDLLGGARAAAESVAETGPVGSLFLRQVTEFEDMILEWVQTPEEEGGKRREAIDYGKTDEDIARLITYILLSPQLGEQGLRAREAIMPHVIGFIQAREADLRGMSKERIDEWLRTVLSAWVGMWREESPVRFRTELAVALRAKRAA